ncbi:DsbA family protein [Paludibacterium yongneupense]|uniref:DsbA family protein n=1 Tax=Paludibacterium yongneupense TaxID=400061 RepID=UPI000429BDA8|nr:DsbA family protein [Paludibacterium yongneupense]
MKTRLLHYIYDPLCGWCYGAAPLIRAAACRLTVVAHAGGMMCDENRQPVSPALRDYVLPHDRRIESLTGQRFGRDYTDGLLRDHAAVFDSEPPTTAILAAEALAGQGLAMLSRLQIAHYVEGRRIAQSGVLSELARDIGLDGEGFDAAFGQASGAPTRAHIGASRALLARVGGRGFPTLALEREGRFDLIDIGPWLGRPEAWEAWLDSPAANADRSGAPVCGPGHCEI